MPLLIFIAVVFGFLLLVTPFIAIASLVKQSTLRKQLNDLVEENSKQHARLQRAIGELQTKVAAGVRLRRRRPKSRHSSPGSSSSRYCAQAHSPCADSALP